MTSTSSAALSLVEAYLDPSSAAVVPYASSAASFSAVKDSSLVSCKPPVLEAFSPRLRSMSARSAAPRSAPLSVAELASYSARDSRREHESWTPAVGSRTPSYVVQVPGKRSSRHSSAVARGPDSPRGVGSVRGSSASVVGELEMQASSRGRKSYHGSDTEITHATTPSWRSRSFPPAIDPSTSTAVAGVRAPSIQTTPRRRLPPLPDEARQVKPYATPSEVRHLDSIDTAVHEANALLVESFLNVKRRLTSDPGGGAASGGSQSYASSRDHSLSIVSHDASARAPQRNSFQPPSHRYHERRQNLATPNLETLREHSEYSRSSFRGSSALVA